MKENVSASLKRGEGGVSEISINAGNAINNPNNSSMILGVDDDSSFQELKTPTGQTSG